MSLPPAIADANVHQTFRRRCRRTDPIEDTLLRDATRRREPAEEEPLNLYAYCLDLLDGRARRPSCRPAR